MSKHTESKIKYCVYCGSLIEENKTYCPKCGKLVLKVESTKKTPKVRPIQKLDISRKCPGCGSIITSTILDQCPICNAELEKLPEVKKAAIQKKPGLIFTSKKLELEQKFLLKKDTWNFKEGINVFGTCIYILVIVFFLLFTIISFQLGSDDYDMNIQLILLSQIPELVFGLYPIWYIYNKKHSFSKLGFYFNSKKIIIAIIIGILGTTILVLINFLNASFLQFISDAGLDFFNIEASIEEQNQIILNADILWIILLTILLCIGVISSEIVFRGVLHHTLKQKFKNDIYVILIVALAYSLIMLLFSFPMGVSFFFLNFIVFTILGVVFEVSNRNIFSTITTNILYNIVIIILIFL